MTVTVFEQDLGTYVDSKAKFKQLDKWKSGDQMISIEIDKVNDVKGDNVVLVAEVRKKAWPIVEREAKDLIKELMKVDALPEGKFKAAEEKAYEDFRKEVGKYLTDLASDVFSGFAQDKSDYKSYQTKAGVRLVVSGGGLLLAAGLTAASSWTGAGSVVGVAMLARGGVSVAQKVANLLAEAEDIQAEIIVHHAKLKKQLESKVIEENTKQQKVAALVNAVFAVEIESIVLTVDNLEERFKLMVAKTKGLKTHAVSLTKDIPKMLDEQQKLAAVFKPFDDLEKATGFKASGYGDARKKLADAEKDIDKALTKANDLMDRTVKLEDWADKHYDLVTQLRRNFKGDTVKNYKLAGEFIGLCMNFASGNWQAGGNLPALADGSKAIAVALGVANDALGAAVDSFDIAYKKYKDFKHKD